MPTPHDDYKAIIDAIGALVEDAEHSLGLARGSSRVGVGTPGSRSRATGLLRGSNSVCMNGKPIADDLAARLGAPVRVANDANCFALSEAADGAGAGADVVFGVILGTGVGGGIVVHGRVLDGVNGIAGEWGHNPLPWPRDDERPGPPAFAARGLHRDVPVRPGHGTRSRARPGATARPRSSQRAARAATRARRGARPLRRAAARALAHVINILDPDVIVLGGGMSNIDALYDRCRALWRDWVFSDRVDTRLVRNAARRFERRARRGVAVAALNARPSRDLQPAPTARLSISRVVPSVAAPSTTRSSTRTRPSVCGTARPCISRTAM